MSGRRRPLMASRLADDGAVYQVRTQGNLLCESRRFSLIDLFAGAGGLTLGFTEPFGHPFRPIWANDFNECAAATYSLNFGPHCTTRDIVDLLKDRSERIPHADVVIGGPPCQGFSLLNKKRRAGPDTQRWHSVVEDPLVDARTRLPRCAASQEAFGL